MLIKITVSPFHPFGSLVFQSFHRLSICDNTLFQTTLACLPCIHGSYDRASAAGELHLQEVQSSSAVAWRITTLADCSHCFYSFAEM